jgi:site-specific recombinase XerD
VHRFSEFVKSRRYLKNVTQRTVDWYQASFAAFERFHPSDEYTKSSLNAFVVALRGSGVSAISCNTYCCAVNAYLRWLQEEGYLEAALRIPRLKTEKKIIATFNRSQVDAFLKWKPRVFSEHRLFALVALLLDCGLRIQEALELRREQVDLENLLVKVKGKGEKHRIVPISFELRRVLHRWLTKHRFELVFPTLQGRDLNQRNSLRDLKLLGRRLHMAGVRVSFHTFRHTFAVSYLRAGGNLFYLSRILGHSSITTTEKYLQSLGVEDLQAVHDKLSLLNPAR